MPTIAQKLCHDIVEPGIKPSSDTVKSRSSGRFINSINRHNAKPLTYMDKPKKYKIEPPHTSGSSNKAQLSGASNLKKKIADSSVNTLVSGALRCDNNCITSLRKRNHQGTCKCSENRKLKVCAKEVQTQNKSYYSLFNKACTQCVETACCGTQFVDNKEQILKQVGMSNKKSKTQIKLTDIKDEYSKYEPCVNKYNCIKKDSNRNQSGSSTVAKPSLRYISAKHWALSNYPTRGPDF